MEYVTIVSAKLKGADARAAQQMHDATVEQLSALTRPMGATGHRAYLNPQKPMEFLAIDRWNNLDGLQNFMGDARVAEAFGALFEGQPDITVWAESHWASF
jgi:hypothetical protein